MDDEHEMGTVAESRMDVIRALNDDMRQGISNGEGRDRVVYSAGIRRLPVHDRREALSLVAEYNDPEFINGSGEHAFGELHYRDHIIVWSIAYRAKSGAVSPDPSNPTLTTRVLTIMLASEY